MMGLQLGDQTHPTQAGGLPCTGFHRVRVEFAGNHRPCLFLLKENSKMETMKMRVLLMGVVMVMMAASMVPNVAAADAPAPSPTSDTAAFVPAALASVVALVFGFLF